MGKQLIDLTGERFGSWKVLRRYPENYENCGHSIPQWVCRCDCGTVSIIPGNNLRSGASTGCVKCREEKRMAGLRDRHRETAKLKGARVYG